MLSENDEGEENRVVRDIGATQVEQPGDLVERRHSQGGAAFFRHLGTYAAHLQTTGTPENCVRKTFAALELLCEKYTKLMILKAVLFFHLAEEALRVSD